MLKHTCLVAFGLATMLVPQSSNACRELAEARLRLEIAEENLANAQTTRTPTGGPYKPKRVECESTGCQVVEEAKEAILYSPEHPDADPKGYVRIPALNSAELRQQIKKLERTYEEAKLACYHPR
jgi:flagellar basal-body rod protein FlgC